MTSGVYPRKPGLWAGNGGRRLPPPPPKLNPEQVESLRKMHEAGVRIKLILRAFGIGPSLLYHVINKQGAYK